MPLLDIFQQTLSDPQIAQSGLRERVKELARGYRNSWDIFSELIQNSVDAINRRYRILNDPDFYLYDVFRKQYEIASNPKYMGIINITLDVLNKTLEITDNGVGIENTNIEKFLLPDESGKALGKEYGFKGYGLTFVAFISREFHLRSRFFLSEDTYEIGLDGLFDWLVDENNKVQFPNAPIPTATVSEEKMDGESCNALVRVRLESDYDTRFSVIAAIDSAFKLIESCEHLDRFEYVLRSRTAIGNTRPLFNKAPIVPIEVKLKVKFANKTREKKEIPYRFYHPREHREIDANYYDFADYVQRLTQVPPPLYFRGLYHTVTGQSVGTRKPIECDIAMLAASSTRLYNIENDLGLDEVDAEDVTISYGVYLAIDGMPTGIRIDDWDNRGTDRRRYYIVVDAALDASNQLDSGRKGISDHYARLISEQAWHLLTTTKIGNSGAFSLFATRNLDYGRASTTILPTQDFQQKVNATRQTGNKHEQEHEALIQKVRKYTSLLYLPTSEQEVIVMFYDLLSRRVIKGYKTVYLSSKAPYDAGFEYEIECNDSNVHPEDPLGIGKTLVQDLRRKKSAKYVHKDHYSGITQLPELCVEFKQTVGQCLEELFRRGTDKDPNTINILITWDDTISPSIPSTSYTLDTMQDNRRLYHATTHKLGLVGQHYTEIPCIVLKEVLTNLPEQF